MLDPFNNQNNTSHWIPYADFLCGILMIFLVGAILLLFHVTNPNNKTNEGDVKSPGSITATVFWKENVDVDLWVKSPHDKPVGYSRKSGLYFDLLRDDLGGKLELVGGMHYENAFARNAPKGEYVINVHMYSNHILQFPVEVEVNVQIVKNNMGDKAMIDKIIKTTVNLDHLGQELTVVRFTLDENGNLVPGSVNNEQLPLRSSENMN